MDGKSNTEQIWNLKVLCLARKKLKLYGDCTVFVFRPFLNKFWEIAKKKNKNNNI